ncbi:uncharacterized protein LOC119338912 [Triticum dicoccoides]|uniref:uncharacterized protein LOC119338912 n=1 Tax=Triticum dicoccoides TaxID=85692 RepID=UPI0018912492|nr:uncharacterized protein LOC119338912 [Triticum dicoccoides]
MTTMMHRTSQIDYAMEAMRVGRGRGGRAAGHEGHDGCGRKQHGLKERRMWAGSEVGGDSLAGRQRAPVSASSMICCISVLLVKVYVGAIMVLGLLIILMFWIWGVAAGEGRRPMTGRRSRPSRSASRRFPVTGSLKLKTGHIVLVMSGWRYCGLMSLEQSDPSKIGVKILGDKGIVVVRSMSPASARHGVHSPKEQGFKGGQQASLDESISLLKQRTSKPNGISLSVLQMAIL